MKYTPAPRFPLPLGVNGVNRIPPLAPVGRWAPDVIASGFESRTIELGEDAEGELVATLVRAPSVRDPRGVVLAIHGWSDYFMQTQLAQWWCDMGYAFYAIDLHKCGRSIRHHHTPRSLDSVHEYFREITLATELISQEVPGAPLVLWAHSQGGLTATLWADRHRSDVAGLALNGPWLDWYGGDVGRRMTGPLLKGLASRRPDLPLPELGPMPYDRNLDRRFGGTWDVVRSWRPGSPRRAQARWLAAVIAAQDETSAIRDLPFPIWTASATHSRLLMGARLAATGDAVIDVWAMRARARRIGTDVTIVTIPGAWHDVTLSPDHVKEQARTHLESWVRNRLNESLTAKPADR